MLRCNRLTYLLLLLPILLLAACGRASTASAEAKPAGVSDPVTRSREADDTARFLAGMPGHPGSPFLSLENDDVWKEHRDLVNAAWHKADGDLLQGLREFQAQELKSAPMTAGPVFYPFSGPDALMATEYFPQSPVYVFAALEPAGTLPSAEDIGAGAQLLYYPPNGSAVSRTGDRRPFAADSPVIGADQSHDTGLPLRASGRAGADDRSYAGLSCVDAIRQQGS